MNMEDLKKEEVVKENSLALKAFDSEESNLDEEQVAFLAKIFKKLFKQKGFNKKGACCKMWSTDKSPSGYYKFDKTNHMFKYFPI